MEEAPLFSISNAASIIDTNYLCGIYFAVEFLSCAGFLGIFVRN